MVMSSRPGLENPVAADHKMPADPGRTEHTPGPLVDMPVPRQLTESGDNIVEGSASDGATQNSTPDHATNGSGWSYGPNKENPPSPEPVWQPSGPQPASHGHSGSHPALKR